VAPWGGIYITHVRDPHRELLESNWEAIEIGRRAGTPVQLTHATTPGRNHRGLMRGVVEMIEDARRRGIKVASDQYPYNAVATVKLWSVLKYPESVAPTPQAMRAALRDPKLAAQIREETLTGGANGFSQFKASGADLLLVLSCPGCGQMENKFIADIADEQQADGYQVIVDLLLKQPTDDIVVSLGGFYEEDMQHMLQQPWTMISSDGFGDLATSADGNPLRSAHPRSKGSFPRVLGHYVRDLQLLTLPDAVRKMTSATADFLGLKGRGRIVVGNAADITIFDPDRIADRSTWKDPGNMAIGIRDVLVNGDFVLRGGKFTDATPGAFLRKGEQQGLPLRPDPRCTTQPIVPVSSAKGPA
jgi:N-acyl-D-aspartate/D-glutamate deacylase